MRLEDIKNTKDETTVISARIPISYKKFIEDNNISLRQLVCITIDELQAQKSTTTSKKSGHNIRKKKGSHEHYRGTFNPIKSQRR